MQSKDENTQSTSPRLLLTIKETAHALNLSEQHCRNKISAGTFPIPVKRIGRAVRVAIKDLYEYVENLKG